MCVCVSVCLSVCLSVCGESERAKASERERESQSETKKISILRRDTYNKKEIKNIRARGEKKRKGTESGV
jgi:hypothetical protein